MSELKYSGKVKDGVLKIVHRAGFDNDIKFFEGKEVEVSVKKKRKKRSNAMNSYYWAEVIPKVRAGLMELGTRLSLKDTDQWLIDYFKSTTPEQAHHYLKTRFIDPEKIDEATGEITKNELSTAKMTNTEFIDYLAPITQFASEILNVQILLPNEHLEENQTI